jgi:hypothetical protein
MRLSTDPSFLGMTSESGTGCTTFQIVGASKLVVLLLVMLRNEAPDFSPKEIFVFSDDTSTMHNRIIERCSE